MQTCEDCGFEYDDSMDGCPACAALDTAGKTTTHFPPIGCALAVVIFIIFASFIIWSVAIR